MDHQGRNGQPQEDGQVVTQLCFIGQTRLIDAIDQSWPKVRDAHLYTWAEEPEVRCTQISEIYRVTRSSMYAEIKKMPNYAEFISVFRDSVQRDESIIDRNLSQFYLTHLAAKNNIGNRLAKTRTDSVITNHSKFTVDRVSNISGKTYNLSWQICGTTHARFGSAGILDDHFIVLSPEYVKKVASLEWLDLVLNKYILLKQHPQIESTGMSVWYSLSHDVIFREDHSVFCQKLHPDTYRDRI